MIFIREEQIQVLVPLVILYGQHSKDAGVFLFTRTKGKETPNALPRDYT